MQTDRSKGTGRVPTDSYQSHVLSAVIHFCSRHAMSLLVRPATPDDAQAVLALIRGLADYERLLHEVEATKADLAASLFAPNPRVFCDLAEWNGEAVGFAL